VFDGEHFVFSWRLVQIGATYSPPDLGERRCNTCWLLFPRSSMLAFVSGWCFVTDRCLSDFCLQISLVLSVVDHCWSNFAAHRELDPQHYPADAAPLALIRMAFFFVANTLSRAKV
jgi:hypothetical protein